MDGQGGRGASFSLSQVSAFLHVSLSRPEVRLRPPSVNNVTSASEDDKQVSNFCPF